MSTNVITMGPGALTIGSAGSLANFAGQCSACRLVPSVDTDDPIAVLDGGEVPGDRSESWTLTGTLLQDLGATESTTEWLFEHRGEQHPFSFTPSTAAGKTISGTLVVEAIEIGGDVKTKPTSDFEFQLVGAPTIGTDSG